MSVHAYHARANLKFVRCNREDIQMFGDCQFDIGADIACVRERKFTRHSFTNGRRKTHRHLLKLGIDKMHLLKIISKHSRNF